MILPAYKHQKVGTQLWLDTDRMLNFSDPGTGKTRMTLDAVAARASEKSTLVLATLSTLRPAWGDDVEKWTPHLPYSIAYAKNRDKAFKADAKFYITNHDAVNWLAQQPASFFDRFDTLVIDESTAFKNRTAARTKALLGLKDRFDYRVALTGTPNPISVQEYWAQVFAIDDGRRLGRNFYGFRDAVCQLVQVRQGQYGMQWVDKPNANDIVMHALRDIVYRVKFEDCTDIPPLTTRDLFVDLPAGVRKAYDEFRREAKLVLDSGTVTAVHAGALRQKLRQILTGQVYDSRGNPVVLHTDRVNLVMDLVEERDHCVVGANFKHEFDALEAEAQRRGLTYATINGEVPVAKREQIVLAFQTGELRVVFAHPKSAGHGLTLTRGTSTILASPCDSPENYRQLERRIYRTGQTKATETIRICARDTVEQKMYDQLSGRLDKLDDILNLFAHYEVAA